MDLIELAKECGAGYAIDADYGTRLTDFSSDRLAVFAARIRADEREECAKVCDGIERQHWDDFKGRFFGPHPRPQNHGNPYTEGRSDGAEDCACAIRSRK